MSAPYSSVLLFFLSICSAHSVASATQAEHVLGPAPKSQDAQWTWVDRSGQVKSESDLQELLKEHTLWIESSHVKGRFADLSGARLVKAGMRGASLRNANLNDTDLSYADLTNANLSGALLQRANLAGTIFTNTELSGADLFETDLSHAKISKSSLSSTNLGKARLNKNSFRDLNFSNADLSEADLNGSDLTGSGLQSVNLRNASLRNAVLVDTGLAGADLEGADLYGATYETNSNPKPKSIAFAKNLEYLTYINDSEALSRLRQQFKEAGFRHHERIITYVLKSRLAELLWENCQKGNGNCFEYWFNTILFDWLCKYGMEYGLPVKIVFWLFIACTIMYVLAMHRSGDSGLGILVGYPYKIHIPTWLSPYANEDDWREVRKEETPIGRLIPIKATIVASSKWSRDYIGHMVRREILLLRAAMFFSLMSTFNIKLRDFDFGRWLRLLTKTEYDMKAYGWVRVIAGFQALFSVYLIALAIVTYFGRPFE